MKFAVMADDFTGAADVGVQFLSSGRRVAAVIDGCSDSSADVVIRSSGTRNCSEKEAYDKVKQMFSEIKEEGFDRFYKKIDSTLRGNIYAEIEAIVELIDKKESIVIAAAFPEMGRIIKNGEHYLNGVPLMETFIAKDVASPVKEGNLLKIFKDVLHISLEDIRNEKKKKKLKNNSKRVIIIDGETAEDMDIVAEAVVETGYDRYIAGAAGIVNYLFNYWDRKNRVAVISGSCSEISLEQINNFLKENCEENFDIINMNSEMILKKQFVFNESIGKRDIVMTSILHKNEIESSKEYFEKSGYSNREGSALLSDVFSDYAAELIKKSGIKNLIILGGESSEKILKKLGINEIELFFCIENGISVAKSKNMRYNIIVKPGNFGSKNCIEKFYKILKYKQY